MTKEEAGKLASEDFFKVSECVDLGDIWVFSRVIPNPEAEEGYDILNGQSFVAVDKQTGEVKPYPIPPVENLVRLSEAKIKEKESR